MESIPIVLWLKWKITCVGGIDRKKKTMDIQYEAYFNPKINVNNDSD